MRFLPFTERPFIYIIAISGATTPKKLVKLRKAYISLM